jgi:acetyl-CoA carboxylase biotin carboxyl carrier protein
MRAVSRKFPWNPAVAPFGMDRHAWIGRRDDPTRLDQESGRRGLSIEVEAQITGSVWKIETSVGVDVEEEDVLLIIESMKMEIPVEAPGAGRVTEIRVREGQAIEEGDVLVVLAG